MEGLEAYPRHQHHRCGPPHRRCRRGRGQDGEDGGREGPIHLGHRRALQAGLLGRCARIEHPPARAVDGRDRLRLADDRIREGDRGQALLRAGKRALFRRFDCRRLRAAGACEHRGRRQWFGGTHRGRGRQAQRRRLCDLAQDPAGRDAADGMGFAVGQRRTGLASRMLGDVRCSAGLPLRHPHRRDRPPRDPPPQRDRAESGALLHEWAG